MADQEELLHSSIIDVTDYVDECRKDPAAKSNPIVEWLDMLSRGLMLPFQADSLLQQTPDVRVKKRARVSMQLSPESKTSSETTRTPSEPIPIPPRKSNEMTSTEHESKMDLDE